MTSHSEGGKLPEVDMFALSCISIAECKELGDLFSLESHARTRSNTDVEACCTLTTSHDIPQIPVPEKHLTRKAKIRSHCRVSWLHVLLLLEVHAYKIWWMRFLTCISRFLALFSLATFSLTAVTLWYCRRESSGHSITNRWAIWVVKRRQRTSADSWGSSDLRWKSNTQWKSKRVIINDHLLSDEKRRNEICNNRDSAPRPGISGFRNTILCNSTFSPACCDYLQMLTWAEMSST